MSESNIPVVSVCIETYNHQHFISKAIEGVLMQELDYPIELVIGEDFSKDSTRKICEEYAARYPEIIRLLPSDKNHGMEANFTRTLQACKGKYVALCEGDDYWTDKLKLKKQVDFLERNKDFSACFTNAEIINETDNSKRIYLCGLSEGIVPLRTLILRGGAIYPTASLLFRNYLVMPDLFLRIKELACDNLLIILLSMTGPVSFIDQITCVYRVWSGGIYSSHMNNKEKTLERKIKTVAGLKKLLRESKKHFRKYLRERISIESLFVLVNDGFFKNLKYLVNLNGKDLIRLFIYRMKNNMIKE